MDASQRVALVTGAANGIGKSIALRLANDEFDVALNDLAQNAGLLQDLKEEIEMLGGKVLVIVADVTVEEEVKRMIDTAVKELGSLDMVANAGIMVFKSINTTSLYDFEQTMAVNVRGVFLCYKYAGLAMIASGTKNGRIVGACSFAGKRGSSMCGAYCASKFAVRGLTQSYAAELGPHGITVNAYAPGIIDTDMVKRIDAAYQAHTSSPAGALYEWGKTLTPLGRTGTARDVAGLVSYLARPEASFVTGQSIPVDGGAFFD
ncbi:acetoin reductase family protein [Pterulicium gracile]|uniref:Acetoin reductase family protein n=1 Tax=Pterulicium gracile TaxID=1884261 RepID=A0A5C3QNB1_9AGAR|nr:acetoin reductase family protein [Pterula gracilis]